MSGSGCSELPLRPQRRNPRRLLAVGFGLLLALPLLQMNFPVLNEKPLVGVENKTKPLRISFSNWWNGTMAESIEVRMSRRIGFRPTLIRVANQFQVAFGDEPSKLENRRVMVCRDNWLISDGYVSHYASPTKELNDSDVRQFVAELKELQDRLRAEGKAMIFVISPSKAEAYPEYLPEWALKERQAYEGESDLERLRRHLAGSGVVVFDVPQYFKQHKNTTPQKFYTKTGIHWNYYTAFQVWRDMLLLVNREYGKNLPVPEQIGVEYDGPRGTDDDIAKLLNVFYLPGVEDPVAYPIVQTNPLPESARPDFLFAGTSFSRTLVDTLYLTESGRNCDYLFYTSRYLSHRIPEEKLSAGEHVDPARTNIKGFESLNWDTTLFDKEIVVIEMLEIRVDELLFGFPKAALAAFKYRSKPDQLAVRPLER